MRRYLGIIGLISPKRNYSSMRFILPRPKFAHLTSHLVKRCLNTLQMFENKVFDIIRHV